MDQDSFEVFQAWLFAEIQKIGQTKGREYANSDDRFANFRRIAGELGLKDYQVGWVYCKKHLDSLASYMKHGRTFSDESVRMRFVDAIAYLVLIAGMVDEESKNTAAAAFAAGDISAGAIYGPYPLRGGSVSPGVWQVGDVPQCASGASGYAVGAGNDAVASGQNGVAQTAKDSGRGV